MLSICGRINDERVKQEWNFIALLFLNRAYLFRFLTSRADCDAPCFKQLKATHLRASPKQLALLDVLLQLIKTWPLTIGPCLQQMILQEKYDQILHTRILREYYIRYSLTSLILKSRYWTLLDSSNVFSLNVFIIV